MRHVLLSGAIATSPQRMINPAATARLVPPPGRALSFTSRCLCTTLCAINLAAITVAADEYLGPTACTQKKSGDRSRGGRVWTRATMIGILPRHACSARVGTASIRDLAVEVGAVPASPIRQFL